eukprot:3338564-Rhodomonas_salina.3
MAEGIAQPVVFPALSCSDTGYAASKDTHDPKFATKIEMEYSFEVRQHMQFLVMDVDDPENIEGGTMIGQSSAEAVSLCLSLSLSFLSRLSHLPLSPRSLRASRSPRSPRSLSFLSLSLFCVTAPATIHDSRVRQQASWSARWGRLPADAVSSAIGLRARYAKPGTDKTYGAPRLQADQAAGTANPRCPTRIPVGEKDGDYGVITVIAEQVMLLPTGLGTDAGCTAATLSAVIDHAPTGLSTDMLVGDSVLTHATLLPDEGEVDGHNKDGLFGKSDPFLKFFRKRADGELEEVPGPL